MTAASRSLATALWKARFASGLLLKCYTTSWDTIRPECVAVKEGRSSASVRARAGDTGAATRQ